MDALNDKLAALDQPETRWEQDGFLLSTENALLDRKAIYRYLSEEAYWSPGIPEALVNLSIDHSLCFGLYHQGDSLTQIGFARLVTDYATFAYLADVFVDKQWRGNGLSKWMMDVIMSHPATLGIRRMMLATQDAHGLYQQFGFDAVGDPDTLMMVRKHKVDFYQH